MTHNANDAQFDTVSGRSRPKKSRLAPWRRLAQYLIGSIALLLICTIVPALRATASAAAPPGVWLMGTKVAIQIFDCSGLLCGRVIWLRDSVDAQGLLKRDTNNPDPAQRHDSLSNQRDSPETSTQTHRKATKRPALRLAVRGGGRG